MLKSITVQNIALIEKTELELGTELNILSGETGAGKSIVIDAVGFVLGERADRSLIRFGTDFATVEAVFENYATTAVCEYLKELDVDCEEVLILRRKMTLEGKNECRINGRIVTLSSLKGLTELLVDIHGQHEHQSLLKVQTHIDLLDCLGGDEVSKLKNELLDVHTKYADLKREITRLGDADERARLLDVLEYQIAEIEKADVKEGEEEALLDFRKRIRNIEKIISAFSTVKNALDGFDVGSASVSIKNSITALESVSEYDNRILSLTDRLYSTKAEVVDVCSTVSDMLDELDFNSRSAEELEERLETVRRIQRKYGGSYTSLTDFYEKAQAKYELLSNATERVENIEKEIGTVGKALVVVSSELSSLRRKIADKFEKDIIHELNDLGMGGSTFKVQIDVADGADKISANGADTVEFLISPNVGEPLKPLAKIISGGEMSRFMLALKNILAEVDEIGTMIFDEIDTGISGNIAAVVAEKMCNISRKRQVIAVTHQPALAAMADSHYLIVKSTADGKTLTHIDRLDDDVEELARLLGGKDYSDHAIPHAKEMKLWADRYKNGIK